MPRDFCTAGPVEATRNYCLPPLERQGLENIRDMIREMRYFVLHAPRQTGKTTALRALAKELQADGVRAVYANIEPAQTARNDVPEGVRTILGCLARDALFFGDAGLHDCALRAKADAAANDAITSALAAWAALDQQRPAVLFLDEVDALVGDVLVSLLRQIRAGYPNRPQAFPLSVILCGVRDVKDYRIHTGDGEIITGGSCFNIKDRSLRIGDFDRLRMEALYAQHTAETGQVFTPEALDLAWQLTMGQPWLVNALGRECCFEDAGVRDRATPITAEHVNDAKERLILSRCTHLDQLADKLTEARVRRVVEPILLGEQSAVPIPPDDRLYVRDLGLIRDTPAGWVIANPIYREVLPRELTWSVQQDMKSRFQPSWITPDGRIDGAALIAGFQEFYGENGEAWADLFTYKEAGVQLLVQAFLQRVANGQGSVLREFPLGQRRADLMLRWPLSDGTFQKIVVELKVLRWDRGTKENPAKAEATGIEQAADYARRCQGDEVHLLLCSRGTPPAGYERVFRRTTTASDGRAVTVWGM